MERAKLGGWDNCTRGCSSYAKSRRVRLASSDGAFMTTHYPSEALERRSGAPATKSGDHRSPFAKDRDRILYARAFRRLAGKSQVAASTETGPFHTRLTHSLKVAQLGRRIAEQLREERAAEIKRTGRSSELHPSQAACIACGDDPEQGSGTSAEQKIAAPDPDLIEFACLAHDIGHPPFGHTGETEINETVQHLIGNLLPHRPKRIKDAVQRSVGRFEGNPQTLRIITRLAHISNSDRSVTDEDGRPLRLGLDLTAASIDATAKYPYYLSSSGQKKWAAYGYPTQTNSDCAVLQWARRKLGQRVESGEARSDKELRMLRSFECQVMDWCDDVTYAVHDVEDFYMIGMIPLDRIFDNGDQILWRTECLSEAQPLRNLLLRDIQLSDADSDDRSSSRQSADHAVAHRRTDRHHDAQALSGRIDDGEIEFYSSEWVKFRDFVKSKWTKAGRVDIQGDRQEITDDFLDGIRRSLCNVYRSPGWDSGVTSIEARKFSHGRANDLITHFVGGVSYSGVPMLYSGDFMIAGSEEAEQSLRNQCDLLKELIWMYVIESPGLATQRSGQKRVIRELVEMHAASSDLLPSHYQELLESGTVGCEGASGITMIGVDMKAIARIRLAADYVASLSEPHALALHTRLTGSELGGLRDFV